ncbi:MAG: hypothetical protein ABIC91_08585 [Nanoarchaeota archaeon]|nr:hypothetical protein [Nanoarchaeota archaeon]MBU1030308.1 hypothetical protein [Nanoarchaeota archaeon]MBU1849321.1 hypothetical protein [Nanoarchaeota archaeon]
MLIEQKLKDLGIEKLLIADDLPENINAAKEYFQGVDGLEVDYCDSGSLAIEKIQSKARVGEQYNFIMSDMEMESPESGLSVIREGFRNYTIGVIVTGRNYNQSDTAAHGPSTTILPTVKSVNGRKNKPEVWQQLFEKSIDHYEKQAPLRGALERSKKYSGESVNFRHRLEPVAAGIMPFLITMYLETYQEIEQVINNE